MRKKVAIYPFYPRLLPCIRNYDKLQDKYEITEVYVPSGLGLVNRDLSYACNHPNIAIKGSSINDFHKSSADILALIDDLDEDFDNNDFADIANIVLQNGKKVNYYAKSTDSVTKDMWKLSEDYKEQVEIIIEAHKHNKLGEAKQPLQTPIILVGGLIEEPDVLEVLLQVYLELKKLGLNISVLTKTPFSLGTDFHCISTLFEGSFDEKSKISSLKTTVKEIEHIEQPDIILIETPDSIIEYNEFADNGYGIRTYMLSLALIPDSIICVIPTELAINDYVEAVGKFVKEKYNAVLDGVHTSNAVIDSLEVIQSHKLSWVHIPLDEVDKNMQKNQQSKIQIINVLHNGTALITKTIINRLSY